MQTIDSIAGVVVQYLAETGLHVVIIAAAVAVALVLFGRKLGPRVRYALWGLVVLRLLLPVVPSSPTSVLNVAQVARADVVAPADPSDLPTRSAAIATDAPTAPAAAVARDHLDEERAEGHTKRSSRPAFVEADLPTVSENYEDEASAAALLGVVPESPGPFPWKRAGFLVWAAGALLALLRLVVRERRFERSLRHARPFAPGRVTALLAAAADGVGVRAPIVVETNAVETPALTGVRRPRLLLPDGLAGRLTDAELAFVFRHELAHLRAGDVSVNWMLALFASLHWFNPVVHVAFSRLRAEREAVRDHTALTGADQGTARAYGETLLRLLSARRPRAAAPAAAAGIVEGPRLPGGRGDLRRRITMLSQFGSHSRVARIAGAVLVATVAVGTLTTATGTSTPARAQDRPLAEFQAPRQNTPQGVRVERERTTPDWERALRRKLDAQIAITGDLRNLAAVFARVRERAGVNLVVHPEDMDDPADHDVDLPVGAVMSADQVLTLSPHGTDIAHHYADGAVYVARAYRLPNYADRRYYDVRAMLDRDARRSVREEGHDLAESGRSITDWYEHDELIDLVRDFGGRDAWSREGTSIEAWKALLVVKQSDSTHAEIKQFLDLLLSRGATATRATPEWEQAIAQQLERRISVGFAQTPLADVVAAIKEQTGVPLVVSEELAEDADHVTLSLEDTSAADVIRWISRLTRLHVAAEHGVLRFTDLPPLEIRCYEIDDILTARSDDDGTDVDHLYELIRHSIEPVTWEELPVRIAHWDGLLVVRQTPTTHGKIADFLATLRRALHD